MSNLDFPPISRRLQETEPLVVGRYVLAAELARGGMATVYVGRLHGDGGFKRVVAIKRLHAQFRTDDHLSTMFLDEARLAARIRHPNVVHAIDVALHDGEMFIVMEYIEGASLSQLMRALGRRKEQIPFAIACAIMSGFRARCRRRAGGMGGVAHHELPARPRRERCRAGVLVEPARGLCFRCSPGRAGPQWCDE